MSTGILPDVTDLEVGIDELARRAGTTVRNVRLYQERGLLPKPIRRGRQAFYTDEHLTRLKLVLRLLGRGYSLVAIKDLVDAWDSDRGLGHVLGVQEAVTAPYVNEEPQRLSREELAALCPTDADLDAVIARDVAMGLVTPTDDGAFLVRSPTFFGIGLRLIELGLPFEEVQDCGERILRAAEALADTMVGTFITHVWRPFCDAGQPEDQVDDILEKVNQMRPLVVEATVSALGLKMQDRTDQAIMEELA